MSATTKDIPKNSSPMPVSITVPGIEGMLGITSCLGIREETGFTHNKKQLLADLARIRDWGADLVITLLEESELKVWGGEAFGDHVIALDMAWLHLPVRTPIIADELAGEKWRATEACICNLLRQGQRVVVHCQEGLDPAGVVAVRFMQRLGLPKAEAVSIVHNANPASPAVSV